MVVNEGASRNITSHHVGGMKKMLNFQRDIPKSLIDVFTRLGSETLG